MEKGPQFRSCFLENAFDSALGTPDLFGNFGYFITFHAQLDYLLMLLRQSFQGLGYGQAQINTGATVPLFPRVLTPLFGDFGRGQANVAFAGSVKSFLRANLVQGDHQEQLPQFLPRRHIVIPMTRLAEKAVKHRLDNIVRFQAMGQLSGATCLDQGPQPPGVAKINLGSRVLTTLGKPP
jgi:hypothetical protein